MATKHPIFKAPNDPNTPIWRYMDFTKFVWMLEKRALFFSRADKMEDPFEGSYPRGNKEVRQNKFKAFAKVDELLALMSRVGKNTPQWTYLSCWHSNLHESAAMWKLYAQTSEAIAVRSTYQLLFDSLPKDIFVGEVAYIDFEKDTVPEGNLFFPFLYKRRSFAHENEIRGVLFDRPAKDGKVDLTQKNPIFGKEIPVDLNNLIEAVYVSPTCSKWFFELVKNVTKKYSLPKEVKQSGLNITPFF